jgi:hypothetical protein
MWHVVMDGGKVTNFENGKGQKCYYCVLNAQIGKNLKTFSALKIAFLKMCPLSTTIKYKLITLTTYPYLKSIYYTQQ